MTSESSLRADGRAFDQLRPVTFERGFTRHAEGSVLVSFGAHARALHRQRPGQGAADS